MTAEILPVINKVNAWWYQFNSFKFISYYVRMIVDAKLCSFGYIQAQDRRSNVDQFICVFLIHCRHVSLFSKLKLEIRKLFSTWYETRDFSTTKRFCGVRFFWQTYPTSTTWHLRHFIYCAHYQLLSPFSVEHANGRTLVLNAPALLDVAGAQLKCLAFLFQIMPRALLRTRHLC